MRALALLILLALAVMVFASVLEHRMQNQPQPPNHKAASHHPHP